MGRIFYNKDNAIRITYGLPLQNVRTLFCPTVCNGVQKWDTFVLTLCRAHLLRSGLGAHLLAGRFHVSRDLFGRLMPGDRHDFELSSIRFDQGAISAHFRLSRIRALASMMSLRITAVIAPFQGFPPS